MSAPAPEPFGIVMVSLHTSPLAQPGQGDAGGLNVYVRHLAIRLAATGHRVWVLTRRDRAGQRAEDLPVPAAAGAARATVLPVPAGPAGPVAKEDLPRWVDDFAAAAPGVLAAAGGCQGEDCRWIVHSHYWLSGLAGLAVSRSLRAPLVHTMHTMAAVKNARDRRSAEPEEREAAEQQIASAADLLVANTPAEREELVDHYGADADRITVIPPGVDTTVFTEHGPVRWPGRPAPLNVLFAGRIQGHKGPQVLLRALGLLRRRHGGPPPLALHLTGAASGRHELDLDAIVAQEGLGDVVSTSGPVSAPDLAAAFRAAHVVAVPSFSESFGLVALEAQACGTPVLAHRVGGLVHAVADGVTGRLVDSLDPADWADAFEAVLADPAAWRALGPAAARRARGFSWDAMADRMTRAYAAL
ncbi:glycosyltransferase [Citricoccus sp. SGAir0253]|uniref:glycosyltransferase n=1 Tax=Citricoccus sp. SGAir0253 TaxID=2567881 RepID=UPI001FEE0C48|nr:glycosyltransferase [Citricoccus sp. SGAir0253]